MKTRILVTVIVLVCMSAFTSTTRPINGKVTSFVDGSALASVRVLVKGTANSFLTDKAGMYWINVPDNHAKLVFSLTGFTTIEVVVGNADVVDVQMRVGVNQPTEDKVNGQGAKRDKGALGNASITGGKQHQKIHAAEYHEGDALPQPQWNTEEYDAIHENIFHGAQQNPLSTFSIDVDAASYSNMRRYIRNGQRPPMDAVRIEEIVNYFDYAYKQPIGEDPFSIYTEVSAAPWNEKHKLLHIGLQGKRISTENLPASNLVFLIDVSGSMDQPNKLPLLKSSLRLLVEQLREQDRIALVVYAGAAGVVLPSTSGKDKATILGALDNLQAGGSTAGGAGIQLAYTIARQRFLQQGNNRVILATDGDFNVGESSNASMERLIEQQRGDGIFLTVLGFGMGNYKDSKMEILADKGNGNYAYIDTILEAQKVLVTEFGGTLFTIAKDVKLQVEFNPVNVKAYRLIGYENRMLRNEDFNNDKKDAGELGSGHTVTALYEIIPQGVDSEFYKIDELKYQLQTPIRGADTSAELVTIKFRYKTPQGSVSKLIVQTVKADRGMSSNGSENFRWSAAVAAFGMKLRNSEYVDGFSYDRVLELASSSRGEDKEGYRAEFIALVKSVGLVANR